MSLRVGRAVSVLRDEGPAGLALRGVNRLQQRLMASRAPQHEIRMLVRYEDAMAVDWTVPPAWRTDPKQVGDGPLRTAWIMHPPGESSGGHQNIFRFIKYLEDAGHAADVYLYDALSPSVDAADIASRLRASRSYPDVRAPFHLYGPEGVQPDTDVIVATGWETAYPAYLDPSHARRVYFVQDYEPAFYPVGSEHTLAENTYRFGFAGLTAGGWLADRLSREYGMTTRSFDFAADGATYHVTNDGERRDVFFYARPVTARRAFELGVMALERFAELRPDVTIHLAGWDTSSYRLGFDHVDHGAMSVSELNGLYNRCAVALVLSLTNLSLLPLELLAAGVIPVVNDGPNNRMVSDNPYIEYCPATPAALARRMVEVLDRPDLPSWSARASASVDPSGWHSSGAQFVRSLEEIVRG